MNIHHECTQIIQLKLEMIRLEKKSKFALDSEAYEKIKIYELEKEEVKDKLQDIYDSLLRYNQQKLFNPKVMLQYKIFIEYLIDITPDQLYHELSFLNDDFIKTCNLFSENVKLQEEMLINLSEFGIWFNFFSLRIKDLKILRNRFLQEKDITALKVNAEETRRINMELFEK